MEIPSAYLTLRPTVMDVDLDALRHNFELIRDYVFPARVMPVVKANAYGHGLSTCASMLESWGAHQLGVACLEEGIALRQAGIRIPILVFAGLYGDQIRNYLEHGLSVTASSVDKLDAIESVAAASGAVASVHLKIDTGMERIGTHYYSASRLLERAARARHCRIEGVFSHLASAEDPSSALTALQLERFVGALRGSALDRPALHIANSAGLLSDRKTHLDIVRPGLMLYGISPAPHLRGKLALRPVMSLTSRVVYFKVVKEGAGVSYGHTWTAPRDSRVVTIPVGYGDGYFRRLSNRGQVLIRGRRYPIVGSVCMDQLMVDIGMGEAYNGDEVTLIGAQGGERITIEELAELAGTVPHEVLVSANLRIPRRFNYQGKLLTTALSAAG